MSDNLEELDLIKSGLSKAEVDDRIKRGLINGDQTIKTKSVGRILVTHIFTFFNAIFVIMAIILAFFAKFDKDGIGNYGFAILVVFNSAVGIFQELKAKRTMDKLSLISAPKVTVIRDGKEEIVAVKDIVMDDIMVLNAGCQICADAVVIGGSMEVNESLITGEPDAILKEKDSTISSGSYVVSGKAYAKVVHIGMDNFAAKISAGAKYFKKPNSEIWRSLQVIIKTMACVVVPLGVTLICVKYFVQGGDLSETVISTIGTLVGLIPNGLVALSSAVFCVSVIKLAKHNTLAQDMYCVETLARVDVLCLDKTGTITEGTMEVQELKCTGRDENELKQNIKNIMSALSDENATANAVRDFVKDLSATKTAESIVPFSSDRKWSGAQFEGRSYVMGAPEFVFPNIAGEINALTKQKAEEGLRVLVIASSDEPFDGNKLPNGLNADGFLFIADKIRKEAPDTLKFFREEGVNVKIISGDNPITVRAVAKRAGLEDCDNIIDMSTLKTDKEVIDAAEKYTIFGRVLPHQKLLLVKALKKNGHTVAMTGDGVNDVLALKEADCSVAMASGSDAAKNVSSLVLLDSNFASMPKVVAEGRQSINNLERSASLFLVKTGYNFLIALLFLIVPSVLPFAPKHLTLLGGVTIGLPSTLLAFEPNHDRIEGRFLPKVLMKTLPGITTVMVGIISIVIATQAIYKGFTTDEQQCLYFIATVFAGYLFVFKTCWPFNLWHAVTFLFVIGLLILCYKVPIPFVHSFFGLYQDITPLMYKILAVVWAILIPVFIVTWVIDRKYNQRFQNAFTAWYDKARLKLIAKEEKRSQKAKA